MATIGTFTKSDNGYSGSLKTLTLSARLKLVPCTKESDKAPDFRIFAGNVELGAAWRRGEGESLSIKLDDPSMSQPIYASLVKGDGEDNYALIWSRRIAD